MNLKKFIPKSIHAKYLEHKNERAIQQMMITEKITHNEAKYKIAIEQYIQRRMIEENISYEESKRKTAIDEFQAYLERLPPMAITD